MRNFRKAEDNPLSAANSVADGGPRDSTPN